VPPPPRRLGRHVYLLHVCVHHACMHVCISVQLYSENKWHKKIQ
jgi:hypothetical protein